MKLKRTVTMIGAALVALAASAGYVQPAPVYIEFQPDNSGYAQGDMVSARFAADETSFIGCGTRVVAISPTDTFEFGFCQAGDSTGQTAFCQTQRKDLLDAMKNTGDFSFIQFVFDANGECQRIGYSTQSFYLPEFKDKKK